MKKTTIALLLSCAFFFTRAQRVSLEPSILEFHLGQAGTQSQSIHITNLSPKTIVFKAYLADWLRDTTGNHQYFRPDTLGSSCASWVHLSRNLIEVPSGKTEELVVQLQAPSDTAQLRRMRWAMLFLQSAEEQDSASNRNKQVQTQVKEILRIGVHIYQTSPLLTQHAAKVLSFKPVALEKNAYDLLMKNTGEVMLQCKAYVELTNVTDGRKYKLDKVEFPVFPNGMRKVKFTMPDSIPTGSYSALAILDIGEDFPLEAVEQVIQL